jgi:hypothetical protein
MSDGESTYSWLQRARAEYASQGRSNAESGSGASPMPRESSEFWDPWEVWLRRIEQPRRRRAEGIG